MATRLRQLRFTIGCAAACAMLALGAATPTPAGDWPAFRGPSGDGTTSDKAPTDWGPERNVRWQTPLPQPGNGSPIVVKDRVFVTSAQDTAGKQRSLLCFAAGSGEPLWSRTVEYSAKEETHETNPYGGTTPVSDGERVVVWHGSAGLFCYDLEGEPLWSRDLGQFRHMWGYGTSPIIHQGRVILHTGPGERVFVTALDVSTGETLWETEEPLEGGPDRNAAGKYMGSWSTPVVARVDGQEQIIVALPTRVNGYDPNTGAIIWTCRGVGHDRGDLVYSSPVIAGEICFLTGGFRGPAMAIRLGGKGDVTDTHRLWRRENQPQSIGTGVYAHGRVFRPNAGPGTIDCIDPASGEVVWTERTGTHWASLVMADNLLYAVSRDAETFVFHPNPEKWEPVAKNNLGGTCHATPAVVEGKIYLRTFAKLYCLQAK